MSRIGCTFRVSLFGAWCRLLVLAMVLAVVPALASAQESKANTKKANTQQSSANSKVVRLVIDFNDGSLKTYRIDWEEGKTLEHYLKSASKHPRGIKMATRGSGPTAFLTSIDGLENQGASGKNWIYRINGELGTKSFALIKPKRGDRVLWKFGKYR